MKPNEQRDWCAWSVFRWNIEVVGAGLHAFNGDGVQCWVNWVDNIGIADHWLRNCRGG